MKKHKCDKCGKEFNSERSLAQHKRDYDHSKLEDKERSFSEKIPTPDYNFREWLKRNRRLVRITGFVLVIGAGVALVLLPNWGTSVPEEEIVSRNGLHRHVDLDIEILGEEQTIPMNVGIGAKEEPIHTNTERNVLHLEFSGMVQKDDIRLSRFFDIWGERFTKECIFDKCNVPEGQLKMFVNGRRNYEFGDYLMRDGDRIEVVFE